MKANLLRFIAALGLILASIATLDLSAFTAILPPEYQAKALALGLMLPAIKEIIFIIGDLADDGKRNGSWVPVLTALLAVTALMFCPGCVTSRTTVTAPDGTVTVTETSAPSAEALSAATEGAAIAARVIAEK